MCKELRLYYTYGCKGNQWTPCEAGTGCRNISGRIQQMPLNCDTVQELPVQPNSWSGLCGGGMMMNVGATIMFGEGDGDGSEIAGIESSGVVIVVGKMVAVSTLVVDGTMMIDVKGGNESVGPDEDGGLAPISNERVCDEDTTPNATSVETGCPMVTVVIGVEELKLTSNVSDERPGL